MGIFPGCVILSRKDRAYPATMAPACSGGIVMGGAVRKKRKAVVEEGACVACGCCVKVCPKAAIAIWKGVCARVSRELCVGCGKCARECPASVIAIQEEEG